MPENENVHVARLNRYLPFSPSHDQIYEEYQQSEDALKLLTRAIDYALGVVKQGAKLIVLTGDAGHGKTHICRRMLEEHLGYTQDQARTQLNNQCRGDHVIQHADILDGVCGVRGLRIFKDFSELPVAVASKRLSELGEHEDAVTVICANEGRLRTVLELASPGTFNALLRDEFSSSFRNGLASQDGSIHIINLNYQSIAATGENKRSLLIEALHQWTSGTRWRTCVTCDSRSACPIFANQAMLTDQSAESSGVRRKNLEMLFSTMERLGAVVTIREMLMVVAYLLTSGLSCKGVHDKVRKSKAGWQYPYAYYNCLFTRPPDLSADKMTRIPILSGLAKLDPGLIASRTVDEKVLNHNNVFPEGTVDLCFPASTDRYSGTIDAASGIDDIIGNPRNKKERQREAEFIRSVVRALRRRAFFDQEAAIENPLKRLGFSEGGKFVEIVSGKLSTKRAGELKRNLIAGLHTIQGLQGKDQESKLNLVDPAFGSATSDAAIIAASVPAQDISLIPLSEKWLIEESLEKYSLSGSVDWLDRHVVLRITSQDQAPRDLLLDLVTFDCIVGAGGGYVAEKFYAHDIRRISSFLGRLAETRKATGDAIDLVIEGHNRSVSIDNGLIYVDGER